MSFTEINNNNTFDFPNEIKVNKSSNFYNPKTSTISRMRKSQIIYGTGVDDYVFNEIKKAKYQGCFDPGSLGNKNIFNDNQNFRNIYNQSNQINNKPNLKNIKNQKKFFDKNKKYSNYTSERIHKHDEGKNLLIEKTEVQYPIKFNKYNYKFIVSSSRNNLNRKHNNSIEYVYYSTPITIKRNYLKNKNHNERNNNYSYFTPIYHDRKYINDTEVHRNKALVMSNLINNYNESSKIMNKTRNNRYLHYSIDNKNSESSYMNSINRENFFSPIIFPNRKTANKTNLNNKKIHTINASYLNNNENILRYSANFLNNNDNSEKEYIMDNIENANLNDENYNENNIHDGKINDNININDSNNENNNDIIIDNINDNINDNLNDNRKNNLKNKINNKYLKNIININDNMSDNDEKKESFDNDNNDENKKYLIRIYRKKLLSLFLERMGCFYLLYFKNIFSDFISLLGGTSKNKKKNDYNFEYKTINNISEIKKSLISNSYYYGYNKQYINLIRDIKNKNIKKNLIINNNKNNNNKKDIISDNKIYLETDHQKKNKESNINNNKNIKKKYILNNKNIMNKKTNMNNEILDIDKKNTIVTNSLSISMSNKKYMKKKISKNIFTKDKQENKNQIISEKNNFPKNKLNENKNKNNDSVQENRKIIKSFDKNPKTKNRPNINKTIKKKALISYNTSTIIKTKSSIKPLLFKKSIPNTLNINNDKKYNFYKINRNKNNIKENINKDNKINSKQKNTVPVYDIIEGKTSDEKLNLSIKYLELDSRNISPRDKNDINQNNYKIENIFVHTFIGNDINKNDFDQNGNNEENEIFQNNNLENAISIITKIMENKEKDDENKNKNIRNNLLLKILKNKINKEKKQYLVLIKKSFELMKNNKIIIKDKSIKKKRKYSLDLLENSKINKEEEGNLPLSKTIGKFRVVIKKVKMHRSLNKDIINDHIRKIKPIKSAKNFTPFITDIDNIPANKFIKKTISITVNKIDKNNQPLKNNISHKYNNILEHNKVKNIERNKSSEEKNEKIIKNNEIKEEKNNNNSIYKEDKEENVNNNSNANIHKEDNINNNLSLHKEKSDYINLSIDSKNENKEDKNDIISSSVKNIYRNIKFIKKSNTKNDGRKSSRNIPKLRKLIESFKKYRKNKSKLNKSSKNESNNDNNTSFNEKYEDYENLIFYLRAQLIYCFLCNSKNNESFND